MSMESHDQGAGPAEQVGVVGGGREIVKQRERKKGGSGGLVIGIAAVVVVGVAGKWLRRFNRRSESTPNTKVAGEGKPGDVLKKVVSPVAESDDRGEAPTEESSVEDKCVGCETPNLVEERCRFFDGDGGISDQDSSSEDLSSSAVIQVKHPVDKLVAADEGQGISPTCRNQKIGPATTALAELVHQSAIYDVPSDGTSLSKTKNLQDDIAEVISRAFGDFGRGELASQELAPTKLTVQVVWEGKPEPEESDVADTAGSRPSSESPVHCHAHNNSEGFTSLSPSESGSESGNGVSDFMDACDTDPPPAGNEVEMEFVKAEAQMEDTRMSPEESEVEPESENSPQATTSIELIISVPASPSAEVKDHLAENVPGLAECSFSAPPHRDEDFEPADRDYYCALAREDSSAVLDETQDDAEDSLGKCDAFHEETREEAESIVRECGASASECQGEAEAKHIAKDNLSLQLTAKRQQDETDSESKEVLKEMEPAIVEKFEALPSSSDADATTTPSTGADAIDAESETDRELVGSAEEEDNATSISEEKVVVNVTTQIIPSKDDGACEITVAKEVGVGDGEVTRKRVEVNLGTEEEEIIVKVKSSVVLPCNPSRPNNASKSTRRDENADSSSKSAKMTTMEFSSRSLTTTKGGKQKLKQQENSRGGTEILRKAILVALIAAIVLMLSEHIKPLKHAS